MESLRSFSAKKAAALISRETFSLSALSLIDPLYTKMKKVGGDNKVVKFSSAFFSGVIGSVVGHPADTALTLWQNGMKVQNFRQLKKGAPVRALSMGGFYVCYKFIKDFF